MNHVAIDLGGRESQICVRQSDGTILEEQKVPTRLLLKLVGNWAKSRVILETSAEAFRIADAVTSAGHEVRVVPATLARTLGVGSRGVKTDRKDARVLSEASCRIDLPSVHVPSEISRALKSICGSREALIESRTKLVNNVRGWLRTQLWRIRSCTPDALPDVVRGHATALQQQVPEHVEQVLRVLETLKSQVRAADAQVRQLAKQHPVCQRMMTVPGIGPVTAVRFLAAIDDVTRFQTAHAVQSYLGLTPGENSSSERQQRTSITKAGPAPVRRTLVQAAWSALRTAPQEPMVRWAMQIAQRRGRFIAVVALARKLAGILFALWRDGTTYRPTRGATSAT